MELFKKAVKTTHFNEKSAKADEKTINIQQVKFTSSNHYLYCPVIVQGFWTTAIVCGGVEVLMTADDPVSV